MVLLSSYFNFSLAVLCSRAATGRASGPFSKTVFSHLCWEGEGRVSAPLSGS